MPKKLMKRRAFLKIIASAAALPVAVVKICGAELRIVQSPVVPQGTFHILPTKVVMVTPKEKDWIISDMLKGMARKIAKAEAKAFYA